MTSEGLFTQLLVIDRLESLLHIRNYDCHDLLCEEYA